MPKIFLPIQVETTPKIIFLYAKQQLTIIDVVLNRTLLVAFHAEVWPSSTQANERPGGPDIPEAEKLIGCHCAPGWAEKAYRRAVKAIALGSRTEVKVLETRMP